MFESVQAISARLGASAPPEPDPGRRGFEDPILDPDGSLIDQLVDWEGVKAAAEARCMLVMAELCVRAESWVAYAPGRRRTDDLGPEDLAAAEIGPALRLSSVTASRRIERAARIVRRLPMTLAALAAGELDIGRVLAIDDATTPLTDELARQVEAVVLPAAGDQTAGELRAALRRAVLLADPDAAEKRRKAAVRERSVRRYARSDGVSAIEAVLSAIDTGEIYELIDDVARGSKTADDPRTMDARRADALVFLLLGRDPNLGPEDPPGDADSQPDGSGSPGPCPPPAEPDEPVWWTSSRPAQSDGHPEAHGTEDQDVDRQEDAQVDERSDNATGVACQNVPTPDDRSETASGLTRLSLTPAPDCKDTGNSVARQNFPTSTDCPDTASAVSHPHPQPAKDRDEVPDRDDCDADGSGVDEGRRHRTAESSSAFELGSRPSQSPGLTPPSHPSTEAASTTATTNGSVSELVARCMAALMSRRPRQPPQVCISSVISSTGRVVQVAELHGDGPMTVEAARDLLERGAARPPPGPAEAVIVTPEQAREHDPPPALAAEVSARDGTCRFPGCRQGAGRCDLDHTVRYPDGPTIARNLAALCRRHHRVKHRAGWRVRQEAGAVLIWTSRTGRVYRTYPRGYDGAWRGTTQPSPWGHDPRRGPPAWTSQVSLGRLRPAACPRRYRRRRTAHVTLGCRRPR